MKILGIVEFHPLDGSDPGLFLLASGPAGEFRTPITQEQAVSFLSQTQRAAPAREEGGGFEDFVGAAGLDDEEDEEPLVVDGGGFSMGATFDDDDGGL